MIASTLVKLVLFLILSWIVKYFWKHRRYYYLAWKIPLGPDNLPIIGISLKFIGKDAKGIFKVLSDFSRPATPSPRAFWLGPYFSVIVDDLDQVQQIYSSKDCVDKPAYVSKFSLSEGLLMANGKTWKSHRKAVQPAFNANIIRSFQTIFNESSKSLMVKLESVPKDVGLDMYDVMLQMALDNILMTTGLAEGTNGELSHRYLSFFRKFTQVIVRKVTRVWLHVDFIYKQSHEHRVEKESLHNGMLKIADEIVKERETRYQKENKTEESEDAINKPQLFIDQIYKYRELFTYEEVLSEVNTMIMTGFDTLGVGIPSTTLLIAFHPEVQQKLYEELQLVFDSGDEEVTEDHLDKLKYMEMVIKESLRFWSVVPWGWKHTKKEMKIGDYLLPAETGIMVPIKDIHRNKKLWGEDANEFKPERFTPELTAKQHPLAYMAFSYGPRNCVGIQYAMNNMKTVLSYMLRNFKVSTAMKMDEIEFEFFVVGKSHSGYMVSLEKRQFEPLKS